MKQVKTLPNDTREANNLKSENKTQSSFFEWKLSARFNVNNPIEDQNFNPLTQMSLNLIITL